MSLENKLVLLNAINKTGDVVATLKATIGEIVSACNAKHCPMGYFSCPIYRRIDCGEVTAKYWANVFGVKEEGDDSPD